MTLPDSGPEEYRQPAQERVSQRPAGALQPHTAGVVRNGCPAPSQEGSGGGCLSSLQRIQPQATSPDTWDLKHLVVDEDHELIYCYVPKVACTNWKRVMMVLTGRGKYSDPMEIPSNEAHVPSNLKTLNQYSIAEINHRLKNYLKFLFVREPFERLVSAYRNKFTLKYNSSFHKRFGTRIVRRYRKNATQDALLSGADVKFKEFAEYLVDPATQRDGPLNEHWQTVYQLCHPCHIHYDLVGKYETLEEDANYLLRLVGVGDSLRFPSYAKSTRTTDVMTAQFFSNISSQQQAQLYQLYKLDFLMFNYSTPSYLRLD
ncbi:hypothetical protein Q5P01_003306 [Channa striata]|uniref:Carbohydrate sulfotransferase n=1 Tax=Channa striata TaxID=64152 RepID=A0AA88NJB4_CHASR|nr:hypothetical protein Q5P01_003306 [Channa striata]